MNSNIYLISFLSIICLSIWNCNNPENYDDIPEIINHNLEFYGFTLIDVGWDDPKDNSDKSNYVDEVAHFSNIADILVTEPEDNIINRLEKF